MDVGPGAQLSQLVARTWYDIEYNGFVMFARRYPFFFFGMLICEPDGSALLCSLPAVRAASRVRVLSTHEKTVPWMLLKLSDPLLPL